MPNLLRPSEYDIIRATLPLVAVLDCKSGGDRFAHFWHLPGMVRMHINDYKPPNRETFGTEWKGETDRFEIYQDESGSENLLVLAFSSITPVLQNIECLGQYLHLSGVFVRHPKPISEAMIANMTAMSKAKWPWRKLLDDKHRVVLIFMLLCLSLFFFRWGPPFPGSDAPLGIRITIYAIVVGIGPAALVWFVAKSWTTFRKKRSALADTLAWYRGDVVIH